MDRRDVPRNGDVRLLRDDGLQVPPRRGQPLFHPLKYGRRRAASVSTWIEAYKGVGLKNLAGQKKLCDKGEKEVDYDSGDIKAVFFNLRYYPTKQNATKNK